jgi:hypothetical protein
MRQTWGNTLANEASKEKASSGLQALLQRKEVLLLITLPSDRNVQIGETISVVPTGSETKPINAKLIAGFTTNRQHHSRSNLLFQRLEQKIFVQACGLAWK